MKTLIEDLPTPKIILCTSRQTLVTRANFCGLIKGDCEKESMNIVMCLPISTVCTVAHRLYPLSLCGPVSQRLLHTFFAEAPSEKRLTIVEPGGGHNLSVRTNWRFSFTIKSSLGTVKRHRERRKLFVTRPLEACCCRLTNVKIEILSTVEKFLRGKS